MSTFRPTSLRLRALPAALVLCAAAVHAADFGTSCSFNGSTVATGGASASMSGSCGGNSIESHGTLYNGPDYSFTQGALTTASASASPGSLHAYSHSAATSSPQSYIYTDDDGTTHIIENEEKALGESAAWASFTDKITVNQGTVYGRVHLRFTVTLSGSTSATPAYGTDANIYARLITDTDRYPGDEEGMIYREPGSYSTDALYWPGTIITLTGDLGARTTAFAGRVYQNTGFGWVLGGYIAAAEATANAANTAAFRVEVLTDGASITVASGHDYARPVPEPASAWLLGAGLLGLLGHARRRRTGAQI